VIFLKTQWLNEEDLKQGAKLIQAGEIVAFPTDTVYGLGADATQETAVKKIFKAKERPDDRPLSVLLADAADIYTYGREVPTAVAKLTQKFWPGPLTIIVNKSDRLAPAVTAGKETVGLRMPDHPLILALIKEVGAPLSTPSANTSGRPSPTLAEHVLADLEGKIAAVIDGGETPVGLESTVLDFSDEKKPLILRPGNITKKAIENTIQQEVFIKEEPAANKKAATSSKKHYEPKVPVYIVDSDWEKAIEQMKNEKIALLANEKIIEGYQEKVTTTFSLGPKNNIEVASKRLFQGLRTLEQSEATVILAEPYTAGDLSISYMNRLQSAANKKRL